MVLRKAIVIVNVGTPDKPDIRPVRKYLTEFLNDKRVIDLPWLSRKILVNLIIIPFRVRRSTALYKKLWTEGGSPLLKYMHSLVAKLKRLAPENTDIYGAMRYGSPSLTSVLGRLAADDYDEIIILPLYPQYALSTTGSVTDLVNSLAEKHENFPQYKIIEQFWSHPSFIDAFARQIKKYSPERFDHIVFSYHGLPLRQVNKVHPGHDSRKCVCEEKMPAWGDKCYKAACYGTSRLLAARLQLDDRHTSTAFQSRLTKNWLAPFTDETLAGLARSGASRVLVVAPSFVADCLETIVEIGEEYKELFIEQGGKELVMVESLNDSTPWAEGVLDICNT